MAGRDELQRIVERALGDEAYADRLRADPGAALAAEGIDPSDEERATLMTALGQPSSAEARTQHLF